MTGNLSGWAEDGVLLLNVALTARRGAETGLHIPHWKPFIQRVINALNDHPETLVFMLWGNHAKAYKSMINKKHMILEAEHPAYAAREGREWKHDNCFSETNKILKEYGREQIEW